MQYKEGNAEDLKQKFWHALESSSFVMLQRDADPESAAPMTASLDSHASSAIWFFTSRDHRFAAKGAATASFASKGHDLFARFRGVLVEETDKARLDKQWSNFVEAWFPGGKQDPNLLFLRMDLGNAAIWSADQGLLTTARMALGMDVRGELKGSYAETTL